MFEEFTKQNSIYGFTYVLHILNKDTYSLENEMTINGNKIIQTDK